jgi:hypothetical protein
VVSDRTTFRRQATKIESDIEDHDENTPKSMREYVELLERVAQIGIEGYTRVHVSISGRSDELYDLAKELKSWTPTGGWSEDALRLFKALEGEDVYT